MIDDILFKKSHGGNDHMATMAVVALSWLHIRANSYNKIFNEIKHISNDDKLSRYNILSFNHNFIW